MAIDKVNKEYQAKLSVWQKCRDVAEGAEAVKLSPTAYIPRLVGQSTIEYNKYVARAVFFEATSRTIEGLVGAMSRKEASIKAPESIAPWLDDITLTGKDVNEFTKDMAREIMRVGRLGLFVDYSEEKKRPFIKLYQTESITNWLDDGKSAVVLKETEEVPAAGAKDRYDTEDQTQYRELLLEGKTFLSRLHVKSKAADGKDVFTVTEITPGTRKQQSLDFIPFRFVSTLGNTACPANPPLLGMVNLNISHFQNSADLEHGRHYTGLPTPYATGVDDKGPAIYLGSSKILRISDPTAKLGFMEFTGEGLGSLERAMEQKEKQMAVLGASLLMPPKKAAEAADTVRMNKSSENSFLVSLAVSIEAALKDAIQWMMLWASETGEVEVELNKDFVDAYLTAQEITALLALVQDGSMRLEHLLWNLQQGEILPPEVDIEEEALLLEDAKANKAATELQAMKDNMAKLSLPPSQKSPASASEAPSPGPSTAPGAQE